jgi:hypothetical protein
LKGSNAKPNVDSTEGYYKNINRIQLELEETLNNELFWRFGNVELHFPRIYKRDETREADIVNRLVGKPVWTVNEGREYLGKLPLEEDGVDELVPNFSQQNPMGNQQGRDQATKLPEEIGNQYETAAERKKFVKKDKIEKNLKREKKK